MSRPSSSRRRLAIDAAAARVGGGASRTAELAHTLRALAPDIEYLFAVNPDIAARLTRLPPRSRLLPVPTLMGPTPARLLWEHLVLPAAIGRARPDWVLSPFNILPLGPGMGSRVRRALIVSNIGPFHPEILSSMRGYWAVRNRLLRTLTYRSLARADVVFLLSREAHRLLRDCLDDRRVTFLPMAPPGPRIIEDAMTFRPSPAPAQAHQFVVVGDLLPYKGVEDAILATSELARRPEHVRLLVVGSDVDARYSATLRDLADERAPGLVSFVGTLSQSHSLGLMRSSVATLFCSRVENTSRVPVEAMAVGSPLIAADVPNSRESCGPAALYYRAGDHRQLAGLMSELLEDDKARAELVDRGRRRISGTDWLAATRIILQRLELL